MALLTLRSNIKRHSSHCGECLFFFGKKPAIFSFNYLPTALISIRYICTRIQDAKRTVAAFFDMMAVVSNRE